MYSLLYIVWLTIYNRVKVAVYIIYNIYILYWCWNINQLPVCYQLKRVNNTTYSTQV